MKRNRNKKPKSQRGLINKPASPKEQAVKKDVGQFVNNAIGLLYSDKQYQTTVDTLKDTSKPPIQRVASAGVPIATFISDSVAKSGVKVGLETLANSAPILVNEIILIAKKEKIFDLDDDEKQAALALTVQDYMNAEFQKGTYDRNQMAQEINQAVSQLPPGQQQELERQGQSVQAGIDKQQAMGMNQNG